jgi:hypothetical protein
MVRSGEGPRELALFGGIYSNWLALAAALDDCRKRRIADIYCLGDLGAFGPHPDRVYPLLADHGVRVLAGNYDDSLARDLEDCQCGYTDPRDNYFARISYAYTRDHTSAANKRFLGSLPREIRLDFQGRRVLLCHGSPRRQNEFLWESTSPDHFLEKLCIAHDADVIAFTHSGIKWQRRLAGGRRAVNVGVLGRPENDGTTHVWYTILRSIDDDETPSSLEVEFVPVAYDHDRLAREMREERLPEEFVETIRRGWWTTCLEILPAKERARGRY